MRICFFLLLSLLFNAVSWSAPTIDCHCFRDRQFNPQSPGAVDAYVLATTQNSLISAIFEVDKKPIVRARMSGVTSRQLWVSHYLAALLGGAPDDWQVQFNTSQSWQPVLAELSKDQRMRLDNWFLQGAETDRAALLIDHLTGQQLAVSASAIKKMRDRGADDKALIASSVLGRLAEVPPVQVLISVQNGDRFWGEWVIEAGLEPADLGSAIRGLAGRR